MEIGNVVEVTDGGCATGTSLADILNYILNGVVVHRYSKITNLIIGRPFIHTHG